MRLSLDGLSNLVAFLVLVVCLALNTDQIYALFDGLFRSVQAVQIEPSRPKEVVPEQPASQEAPPPAATEETLDRIADLVPSDYQDLTIAMARRFDIDPRLLAAVVSTASSWESTATGPYGEGGLMQILPSTAEWIAPQVGFPEYDLHEPVTNMVMGSWYLRTLHDEYGDWHRALAAYNSGPRGALAPDKNPYVQRVMQLYASD